MCHLNGWLMLWLKYELNGNVGTLLRGITVQGFPRSDGLGGSFSTFSKIRGGVKLTGFKRQYFDDRFKKFFQKDFFPKIFPMKA